MCEATHSRQLGYHHQHRRQQVQRKRPNSIMRIMRAHKEQHNRHTEQVLLRRRELLLIVNLLPHVEVVVGAAVEVEGDAADPVEHEVGAGHVGEVCESPANFLGDAGDNVEEDLEAEDEDWVDEPGACVL